MSTRKCAKCKGAGWVWCHELDDYERPHGLLQDDTRYTCDWCDGDGEMETAPECELCGEDLKDVRYAKFDHESFCLCSTCITQLGAVVATAKPLPDSIMAPVVPMGLPITGITRDNIKGETRVRVRGDNWLTIRDSDLAREELCEAISEHTSRD